MRRSGTSSVCQALSLLGVSFGNPKNLIAADEHNPHGYWELASLNGSHRVFNSSLNLINPSVDPLPMDWEDRPGTKNLIASASRALREARSGVSGAFAWKALDGSQAIPYIEAYSRDVEIEPIYLVCVRDPAEVGYSEQRANGTAAIQSMGTWMAYTLGALLDCPSGRRQILIADRFRENPRVVLQSVVDAIGVTPSEEQWREAISSVRPDMMKRVDTENPVRAPQMMRRLYQVALNLADLKPSASQELEECRQEWDALRRAIELPQIAVAAITASWARGVDTKRNEIRYQVQQSWMNFRIDSTVLPGSELTLGIYPGPALVWLRSAVWRAGEQEWPAKVSAGSKCRMTDQGSLRVGLILGHLDQFRFTAPVAKGPFTLEVEVLVETSRQITSDAVSVLG